MQGDIPVNLGEVDTFMIVDWDWAIVNPIDKFTWPPTEALLSDLVVFKMVSSKIPLRDRCSRWPKVFQSVGNGERWPSM